MAEEQARARMAAQATREQRLAVADIVIDNSGSREDLDRRVAEVWGELRARAAGGETGPNAAFGLTLTCRPKRAFGAARGAGRRGAGSGASSGPGRPGRRGWRWRCPAVRVNRAAGQRLVVAGLTS